MKRTLGEVCRLINLMDVLYYVGDMMYKKSLRYTGITAAVSLLGFLGGLLPGVKTYEIQVAIVLPLLVGGSALVGGLLLKLIPNVIASRLVSVAEAQDLDLMEDYRKAQQEMHLEWLWQRVFRFEWAVGSAISRVRPHPTECPPEVYNDRGGPADADQRARRQFMVRARFALTRAQPQARQRYYLGVDLRYLEDWRNGGFFDGNDNKLVEQFDAAATLEAVKREVGYGRLAALWDLPLRISRRFWFAMICRVIGIQVGDVVGDLNRHYGTDYFNAQVVLWPGEDEEPWLDQFPLSREELRRRRRRIIERVFGRTEDDARRMLDRMLLPSFWLAARLRAAYDPEYCDGSLGSTAVSDMEAIGIAPQRIEPFRGLVRQVTAEWQTLEACLRDYNPELLAENNGEALRAVRVAMHTNRQGMAALLRQYADDPANQVRTAALIHPIVQDVIKEKGTYSERLVAIRVHQELTRLHYEGYRDLLAALRKADKSVGGCDII